MATRYHYLPSEILQRADTLDIYVMNSILTYEHKLRAAEKNGGRPVAPDLSTAELTRLLEQSRQKQNG